MQNFRNNKSSNVVGIASGVAMLVSSSLIASGSAYAAGVLEEIIVTAQKREQSLAEVPISVSVVSGAKLDSLGVDTFEALDDHVPNLFIGDSPGNNQIYLRGIGTEGGSEALEQSAALFVNDVYGGRARQFQAPFFDVERIEVLRGPQGALVGKNTSAGAISVTTRKPTEETEMKISANYEFEFESNTITAIASGAISDNFLGRLAIQHGERGGYVNNTSKNSDEPDGSQLLIRATGVTNITDNLEATLMVEYADTEVDGHPFANGPTGTNDLVFERTSSAPEFEDQQTLNVMANLDWKLDNDFSFVSITAFTDLESDNAFDADFSPLPSADAVFTDDFRQFSQEFRLLSPEGDRFNYVLGLYYLDRQVETSRTSDLDIAGIFTGDWTGEFREDSQLYSIFGQFSYQISEAFSVSSSLRFTEEDKEGSLERTINGVVLPTFLGTPVSDEFSDSEFDGSLSFQWEPNDAVMVYASYTQGSKSGAFAGASEAITVDGFTLDPENSESIEIGTKLTLLDDALFIGAAYFTTDYEDLQVSAWNGSFFNIRNAAETEVDGFEVDMVWSVNEHWRLSGSLGILDGEYSSYPDGSCTEPDHVIPGCITDLSGEDLAYSPDYSGTLDLEYSNQVGDSLTFTGTLGVTFRDDTHVHPSLMDEAEVEGHSKVNLRLQLESESGWMLAIIGKNLTDEETFSQAFESPLTAPPGVTPDHNAVTRYLDRPRTISLEVAYRFR